MSERINIEQRMAERETAFRLIFQIPFHEDRTETEAGMAALLEETDLEEMTLVSGNFSEALTQAVLDQTESIDALIEKYVKDGWSIDRIPKAELAVLRLATAELLYLGTPRQIVINEAVNLVKKYGDEEGYVFVNGILHQLTEDRKKEKMTESETEDSPAED